jgi:hypothetical protein
MNHLDARWQLRCAGLVVELSKAANSIPSELESSAACKNTEIGGRI